MIFQKKIETFLSFTPREQPLKKSDELFDISMAFDTKKPSFFLKKTIFSLEYQLFGDVRQVLCRK